jgi:hypothetical protein
MTESVDEKPETPQAEDTAYAESRPPREEDLPDQTVQDGVRIVEAMTMSWSRTSLIVVYIRQVIARRQTTDTELTKVLS